MKQLYVHNDDNTFEVVTNPVPDNLVKALRQAGTHLKAHTLKINFRAPFVLLTPEHSDFSPRVLGVLRELVDELTAEGETVESDLPCLPEERASRALYVWDVRPHDYVSEEEQEAREARGYKGGRRPEPPENPCERGQVFKSVKHAAEWLGVKHAYLSFKLRGLRDNWENIWIRGVQFRWKADVDREDREEHARKTYLEAQPNPIPDLVGGGGPIIARLRRPPETQVPTEQEPGADTVDTTKKGETAS